MSRPYASRPVVSSLHVTTRVKLPWRGAFRLLPLEPPPPPPLSPIQIINPVSSAIWREILPNPRQLWEEKFPVSHKWKNLKTKQLIFFKSLSYVWIYPMSEYIFSGKCVGIVEGAVEKFSEENIMLWKTISYYYYCYCFCLLLFLLLLKGRCHWCE